MSSQDRGPAYLLSLLAGSLLLLGGIFRAVSVGMLPARAFGAGYRFMLRTFPDANFGLGPILLEASAIVGIVSGIVVLTGAVMLGSKIEQNAIWGAVIIVFSAIGLLGGGGFFIGSVLGMLAGVIAVAWRPVARTVSTNRTSTP